MDRTITLNHITKIEGHAKLNLGIDKGKVAVCELSSTEGSRYFEGLVKGRRFNEAHEITSRICGICSSAHVVAAITAVEHALGYTPTVQTKTLRTLLTLGERIRSHATHLYFLALPDYLGYESALAMAPTFKDELKRALNLIKIGNHVIKVLAARDVHPVSATVGGWYKLPNKESLSELAKELTLAKKDAMATCDLFFSLQYPSFESKTEFFTLSHDKEYAVLDGVFTGDSGSYEINKYREFIQEYHEPRSTANFVVKTDHRYTVGALARINHNQKFLSPSAKKMLTKSGIVFPSKNPYHNNVAQAIELVHCIDQAIEICKTLEIRPESLSQIPLRAGTGVAAIEVPRGTLWHEYTLDQNGIITQANIITPTAQNLLNIQEDIRDFVPTLLDKTKEELILSIEQLIRSYDPCFSCSAHFLEVNFIDP